VPGRKRNDEIAMGEGRNIPTLQDAHERKCIPLPGRKFVDVDYRCEECGAEVLRAVPRER
jgi:hypothetical protein